MASGIQDKQQVDPNLDVSIYVVQNGFIVRPYIGSDPILMYDPRNDAYVFNTFEQLSMWLQARFVRVPIRVPIVDTRDPEQSVSGKSTGDYIRDMRNIGSGKGSTGE